MLRQTLHSTYFRYTVIAVLLMSALLSAYSLKGQYELSKISPHIRNSFVPVDLHSERSFAAAFDSQLISSLIDNKTIIGFGEATHGTKEFREAFVQVAKQLIKEGSINVVVLAEHDFANSWKLNQFVLDSSFTYQPSLQDESFDALAEWIREHNKGKREEDKVFMLGGDILFARDAALNALEFCHRHNLALPATTVELLHEVAYGSVELVSQYEKAKPLAHALDAVAPLQQKVLDYASGRGGLSMKDLWYVQSIKTLDGALRQRHALNAEEIGVRDSVMFENVQWINSHRPNAKTLVFAHNAHVEKEKGIYRNQLGAPINLPRLGWLLSRHYGERYATIATDAEGGTQWAGGRNTIKIAQARDKVGNIIGKSVQQESGILVFNTDPLKAYFNRKLTTTYGGGAIRYSAKGSAYFPVADYARAFNGILWIRNTNPHIPYPLPQYNLVASYSKEQYQALFSQTSNLKVSLNLEYTTLTNSWGEVPSFTVLAFDAHKKLIYFHVEPLHNGSLETEISLPDKTANLMAFISGNGTESLRLSRFAINGTESSDKLMFNGSHYSRSTDSGIRLDLLKSEDL